MRECFHIKNRPNFQKGNLAFLKNKQAGRFHKTIFKLLEKLFHFIQLCSLTLFFFIAETGGAQTFQELRKTISASPSTQPEATINQFLMMGLEENKPTQAIMETEKWLRQNLPKDEMLLYKAAQAAELSGDWKSAVAYYQQYLEQADLQSDTADEAVYVVYSILIHQLKDTSAAYSFSRNEGDRVIVCPRARQFDQWFLNEAVKRQDAIAVANRLQACIKAGFPPALMTVHYEGYLRWLLSQVDGYIDRGRQIPITDELVDAYKKLSRTLNFSKEMALRLDWAISVRSYNLAKSDDKDVEPPLNEAKKLLDAYPRLASWVQAGWAGGGHGRYYRKDPSKYWPHQLEAKMDLIIQAATRLNPEQRTALLNTWKNDHDANRDVKPLQTKAVRNYLAANPGLVKGRNTLLILEKPWNQYTPEEASKLAPKITLNRHPEAAYIRAIAAGGKEKNLERMIDALVGPEAWRLGSAELDSRFADQLWHYAGRPGGSQKRDLEIKRSKQISEQIRKLDVKKESPREQRLKALNKLWSDYRSAQPKIPGVYNRLTRILQFTPEAIPGLLADPNPESQILAKNAIASGILGSEPVWKELESANRVDVNTYAPGILYLANRHRGLEDMKKRYPLKARAHPLEPALLKTISEDLKRNKVEAWKVMAWINMQYPEDNGKQVELMKALFTSPLWKDMPFEVQYAARKWFKKAAMTEAEQAQLDLADPKLVFHDLTTLSDESDVESTVKALEAAIQGIRNAPSNIEVNGLDQLATVSHKVFVDPKVMELILKIIDYRPGPGTSGVFLKRVNAVVQKTQDPHQLQRTASYLWPYIASVEPRALYEPMKKFISGLIKTDPETASTLARGGLRAITSARPSYGFDPRQHVGDMQTLVGQIAMELGLVVIPVPKNHPAYAVYLAQGEWIKGNEDSAGLLLDENADQLLQVYRNLSQPFLLWALQRSIYSRDQEMQEDLVKSLLEWMKEAGSPFTLEEKIRIEIAYGDIAMQRNQVREALEIFSRTRKNTAYQKTLTVHDATLREVRAKRIAKNFDGALQTLANLEFERIPEIWTKLRFARAEVYFDMEEYEDAAEDIDDILTREPHHPDAKIMLGKVQLKREKLMEATEVELGSAMAQKFLVPGEKLKVTLTDPTLDVSGAGSEIEVLVWADSGDKEQFFLRRFGDEKTKFRGELTTGLGKPSQDDGILQVIGEDKIYYAYSDRFRKKMSGLEEKKGGPITVASDALLMASARKLLTEAEQRVADMEKLLEEVGGNKAAAKKNQAAKNLDSENREDTNLDFDSNIQSIVKPGNPIHVRVIDPDRSRTEDIDELIVSVSSSSGDSVSRITLKETGTHSGWFEGTIPTTEAQAMALASTSEAGRNPNMVISPKDDYPAWRPETEKGKHPVFTVDLNDNIDLGKFTISAKESGAKLTKFVLQTGMNHREMHSVAVYPEDQLTLEKPWHPSVTIMNDTDHFHQRHDRTVYDLKEISHHIEWGWMSQQWAAGIAGNVSGPSQALDPKLPAKVKWQRNGRHHNAHVIYRFRGYFFEPTNATRRFKLVLGKFEIPKNTHPSVAHPPEFLLAVNGRPITNKEKKNELEGSINLRAGINRFEIWATGWDNTIGFGRPIKLLANLNDADQLVPCPDSFFDPETFPPGTLVHRNSRTKITSNEDGSVFDADFGENSKARLIRLHLIQNEGAVPAINRITLTNAKGKQVLPVKEDYAGLLKNDTLEILADDRISVRYVDDRFVTKSKEKHERFLDVRFTNARVEFADMEPRWDSRKGEMAPFYEKLLRFPYGDALTLAVHDADMDSTIEPDTVNVRIKVGKGAEKEYQAKETEDSTGVFKLVVTPVKPGTKISSGLANPIVVPAGETIYAVYRDQETTQPGVATDRIGLITHAAFQQPQFRIGHAGKVEFHEDNVWMVESTLQDTVNPPEGGFKLLHGQIAHFEVEAPHLIFRRSDNIKIFLQTDSGRQAASVGGQEGFDINIPGTISVLGGLTSTGIDLRSNSPEIMETRRRLSKNYKGGQVWSGIDEKNISTFRFSVPLVAGILPDHGYLTSDQKKDRAEKAAKSRFTGMGETEVKGLIVKPGENIHLGLPYKDALGNNKWLTASAKVITYPIFKITDQKYLESISTAYAGENLHLYVSDLGSDLTDATDSITLLLQAKSGAKGRVSLYETEPHSGEFTGAYTLSYAQKPGELQEGHDIKTQGFPVVYGDTVGARYYDPNGIKSPIRLVTISKGANGKIEPFSKRYDDPEVAVRTQFSLAEAYLEMAKRHRKLGETELARQEFASAKQLLNSSLDQFHAPETRSHAEYLLGNLTLEEALAATTPETKDTRFRAALARFMNVTGTYPDTLHASKAQFKVATIYEALKEPDIAAQEYVKLAYKHPDSEYLATSMARLGSHFLKKAASYESKAKPLLASGEAGDKDAAFEGAAMEKMAHKEYYKTAKIFERLLERFPDHTLAGQAGLRSGQAYMRSGKTKEALNAFLAVTNEESFDKEVRSASMYWAGMCYQNLRNVMSAYSIYKRLTYDFPETDWAKYARGQLSQPGMLNLEMELEEERLKSEILK